MKTPYWLRVLIALDALVQITWRYGVPGVTISSRAGTAKAHGHKWGCWLCDFLDRAWWIGFGRDPDGTGHCESAIKHDRERAEAALKELEGD